MQTEAIANFPHAKFKTRGLEDDACYHFSNRQQIFNIKEFGDLINMISSVYIKKDSLIKKIIDKTKHSVISYVNIMKVEIPFLMLVKIM